MVCAHSTGGPCLHLFRKEKGKRGEQRLHPPDHVPWTELSWKLRGAVEVTGTQERGLGSGGGCVSVSSGTRERRRRQTSGEARTAAVRPGSVPASDPLPSVAWGPGTPSLSDPHPPGGTPPSTVPEEKQFFLSFHNDTQAAYKNVCKTTGHRRNRRDSGQGAPCGGRCSWKASPWAVSGHVTKAKTRSRTRHTVLATWP